MANHRRANLVVWSMAALHALLFALMFPPFDWWWLAFIAPLPLGLAAVTARSSVGAAIATLITQVPMWLWLLRWIIPVTAVGYPALAVYMSVWAVVSVWALRRLHRHRLFHRVPLLILLPVVWTGVEFFRGDVLFHGYPWYLLGHPLIAWLPFVQSADLFGTYFISFLCAAVAGCILDLMKCFITRRDRSSDEIVATSATPDHRLSLRAAITTGAVLAFLFSGNIAYGVWRLHQTGSLTPGPRVLALQTDVPLHIKIRWTKEDQTRDFEQFMNLTRDAAQVDPEPDVIVWPETMVPGVGFEQQTLEKAREMYEVHGWDLQHLYQWPLALLNLQRELNVPMLVGSEAWVETIDTWEGSKVRLEPRFNYNSAYLIEGEPPFQRYDKYFLTPFGETMPYISAWPWLERQFLRIGVGADLAFDLDSNPDVRLLQLNYVDDAGVHRRASMATPICFEDTVARFCRRMIYSQGVKAADLFINISNDGWFHTSNADRILHAMIARFRTIENRVPMVRSVNTGMSLWVDSCGRILDSVDAAQRDGQEEADVGPYGTPLQQGVVLANVQIDARHPLYARVGEAWPIGCLLLTLAGLLVPWFKRHY